MQIWLKLDLNVFQSKCAFTDEVNFDIMSYFQDGSHGRRTLGALKMLDVKMTDQMTGHENAGHEIAGHEIAGYETDSEAANV